MKLDFSSEKQIFNSLFLNFYLSVVHFSRLSHVTQKVHPKPDFSLFEELG